MSAFVRIACCWATLVGAAVTQTDRSTERPRSDLFRGQVAELLDRDFDAARAAYRQVVDDGIAPYEEDSLARSRLLELAKLAGDKTEIAKVAPPVRDLTRFAARLLTAQDLPRAELHDALAMPPGTARTTALRRLRERIHNAQIPTRRLVPVTLLRLERAETERLRELLAQLQRARKDKDRSTAADLERQIRLLRTSALRRGMRYWGFEITSLMLEGKPVEADRIRRRIGLSSKPKPIPSRQHETFVEDFLRRVTRRVKSRETTARERAILRDLHDRIRELADRDRWSDAVDFITRLPFTE